jgi:hypothetical protein
VTPGTLETERIDMSNGNGKSPKSVEEQDAPEPVRPVTPQESAGQDIASLDDPPQAEGDRDDDEEEPAS